MLTFELIYHNGRDRVASHKVQATDIDHASAIGINYGHIAHHFGENAAWFLVGVVQTDYDYLVQAWLNETESPG